MPPISDRVREAVGTSGREVGKRDLMAVERVPIEWFLDRRDALIKSSTRGFLNTRSLFNKVMRNKGEFKGMISTETVENDWKKMVRDLGAEGTVLEHMVALHAQVFFDQVAKNAMLEVNDVHQEYARLFVLYKGFMDRLDTKRPGRFVQQAQPTKTIEAELESIKSELVEQELQGILREEKSKELAGV